MGLRSWSSPIKIKFCSDKEPINAFQVSSALSFHLKNWRRTQRTQSIIDICFSLSRCFTYRKTHWWDAWCKLYVYHHLSHALQALVLTKLLDHSLSLFLSFWLSLSLSSLGPSFSLHSFFQIPQKATAEHSMYSNVQYSTVRIHSEIQRAVFWVISLQRPELIWSIPEMTIFWYTVLSLQMYRLISSVTCCVDRTMQFASQALWVVPRPVLSPIFREGPGHRPKGLSLNKSQLLFRHSHSSNRFLLPFEKQPSQFYCSNI